MSKTVMGPVVGAAIALALAASPAIAGIHYQSVMKVEGERGRTQSMAAEGWVEGDKAKVMFTSSTNPMMAEGTYLLTSDGGQTLLLVNPKEKTYMAFDPAAMLAGAGAMLKGLGPMMKMSFSNQKVEKLLEEPGGAILGYPTTHYRFHTSYDSEIKVMGMGQAMHNDTVSDTWTTTALSDAGFGAWLHREPPRTGIPDLDNMIAGEIKKGIKGVPLRVSSAATSRDQRGQEHKTATTMEVTAMKPEAIPPGTFGVPVGYTKTEMASMTSPHGR